MLRFVSHLRRSAALSAACLLAVGLTLVPPVALHGQGQQLQFIVGAADANGVPVTDLKPEEIVMTENGVAGKVVNMEPFRLPLKVTVAVDNGPESAEALGHYRSGLKGFVEALPADVEMTLITTAPQPRMVVRPTTDRTQILRGVNGFAPEQERARFTDTLVEYSERLQKEIKDKKLTADYVPILVMVSTTGNEVSSVQVREIENAIKFLVARRAKLIVTMMSTKAGDATAAADINTNRQALIAIPAAKATGGRYEALAISSRLATLLPEIGKELAATHTKQINQFRVTVQRPAAATGPLQNPRVEITRAGLTGSVTVDGRMP